MVERGDLDSRSPMRPDALVAWALGTFHACLLIVLLVLLLYRRGAVAGLLGETGTVAGILLFLSLWAISVWTTGRALRGVLGGSTRVAGWDVAVGRAAVWGGFAGSLFLFCLVAVVLLPAVVQNWSGPSAGFLVAVPFLLVAAGVAFVVGAMVGALFGGLDVLLLRTRDALLRKEG